MTPEQIIKIIEDSFDSHISPWAAETCLGIESGIDGKDKFFEEIKEKLEEFKSSQILNVKKKQKSSKKQSSSNFEWNKTINSLFAKK